jgi:hypothetical protein
LEMVLTISIGFIMGYDQKLLVNSPTQRKVVFFASSGRVDLMSSAAWSLPYTIVSIVTSNTLSTLGQNH